ncbi:winged helix-turn-helix transcriptional regulator [Pseudorhodoplanes sp.]|uniref:winged helix-turn-helix transcriptional regulator n=1 Tax=Pseudorhodoplanes sp. TaxID=1934341 RepID=UPI003919CA34
MLKLRKSKVSPPPLACPMTECMALLGGAWTPDVIWSLSGGPRRFGELRADIPVISSKVLSARLQKLAEKGVIERRVMPTSPPSVEYSLTPLGEELIPAINAIVSIGRRLLARTKRERPELRRRQAARR